MLKLRPLSHQTKSQDTKHSQPVQPSSVSRNGAQGMPAVSTSVLATAALPPPPRDIRHPTPTGLEGLPAQDRSTRPEEAPHQPRQISARELDLWGRALVLHTEALELIIEPFDSSAKLRCGARCAVPAWLVTGAAGVVTGLGASLYASHALGSGDGPGVDGADIAFITAGTLFLGLTGAVLAGVPGCIQRVRRNARETEALLAEAKLTLR